MTKTTLGLLVGLILGLAAAAGGFWGFLITLVLGALGLGLGAYLDGDLSLADLGHRLDRRRG